VLPAELTTRGGVYTLRRAVEEDVTTIVTLLAADQLGATRDSADDLAPYIAAFRAIDPDPAQQLLVATDTTGEVIATMQLTIIPGLARRGALRMQIEAVRVHVAHRATGLGAAMMRWAIEDARRRFCALVQLTSDKARVDAHRFYERLGFTPSHEGFKLRL
jgi:GNAT superfamily N-acetyltransferase